MDKREHKYNTTPPWVEDEYIRVNGHKLAYKMKGERYIVHFGGGVSVPLRILVEEGHNILLPRRPRRSAKPKQEAAA